MSSLKEIKARIASVNTTLKTTSAMKMVASAKLRKAQNAIGNMLPYETRLRHILVDLIESDETFSSPYAAIRPLSRVAVVCFSSNSSLCGAFNSNVIKKSLSVISEYEGEGCAVTVFAIGRKAAEAMRKAGYPSEDLSSLADKPAYSAAGAFAQRLMDDFAQGRFDRIEFVHNHFKSTASQPTVRESYLPLSTEDHYVSGGQMDYIIEPGRNELLANLLPKSLRLKVYTVLLDAAAAEHAARTVAMQTATDNGKELLAQLSLEYNKGRQQKITSEILDIVGSAFA